LTGIILENAGNLIHDPRNKFIKLPSQEIVRWGGVLFCMWFLKCVCWCPMLSFYFLLLKIRTEWWIREDTHFSFCLSIKNIHYLCILHSLIYLDTNLHASFKGENLVGSMSLFLQRCMDNLWW